MKDLQTKNQMIIPNFIDWKISRALKKRIPYKGINPAQSICFICNFEDKSARDFLLKYSTDLKKRNKEVFNLFFYDGSRNKFEKEFSDFSDLDLITRSDFGLFAGIKGDKYKSLMDKSFDLLCNFDVPKSGLCHLLSAQSLARFKIGIDLQQTEIYDLIIDREKSASIKQLIHDLEEVMSRVFSHHLSTN